MSHHFVNNFAENTCELINPYILIVEGKIPDVNKIWAIASRAAEQKRPLVIIAEDFDYSIPASLIKNKAAFQSCVIKYNFIGDTKQELMYDLCAVTGATVAESRGDKMEELPDTYLGSCEKIVIGKDETLIVAGSGGGCLRVGPDWPHPRQRGQAPPPMTRPSRKKPRRSAAKPVHRHAFN
jgi:chaperonin GroEL